ncbi:MAG: antibiotic biosynthesis monooxygenase [Pseudomonadales bacterium]|nr:antibiotic biosynthesis monooxygenase [Pseudomonadales bacterium]
MIMVQSTFHLRPESKDDAIRLMKRMVRKSREEEGCLSYEYYEGITDPNQVILLQEWENADCLEEHYQTEHMEQFLGRLGELLESPVSTRSYMAPQDQESPKPSLSDEPPKPEQTIH